MNYLELKLQGLDKDGNENEYTLADFKGLKATKNLKKNMI